MRQLVGAVGVALLLIGLPSNYQDLLRLRGWATQLLGDSYAPFVLIAGVALIAVWGAWGRIFSKRRPAGGIPHEVAPIEYTGPVEFPLIRSMAENLTDRRREREAAKDKFVFLVPGGPDKSYSRADVDLLSWTQRQRLFDQDGSSEDWYRGRRMDLGSWPMVRFDDPGPGGPIWMTFPELRNLSGPDRSAVLKKFNGSIRHWYLRTLKEYGE